MNFGLPVTIQMVQSINPSPPSTSNLSLYIQLVKDLLDKNKFEQIVCKHGADKYCKKFHDWRQLGGYLLPHGFQPFDQGYS